MLYVIKLVRNDIPTYFIGFRFLHPQANEAEPAWSRRGGWFFSQEQIEELMPTIKKYHPDAVAVCTLLPE